MADSEYHRIWWEKNKDKYRQRRKEYEKEYQKKFPEVRLYNTCKSRAKKQGILFNLELSDIIIPDVCPVLNKTMVRCTPYAPSIDRIIPDKGYTKGNIQVISKLANVMKNNASEEDLRSFAQWVLRNY